MLRLLYTRADTRMCIRVSKQANQLRDSVPLNTGLRSMRAEGNRETLFLPTTGRPLFDGEGNKKKKLSQESLFLTSLVPQTSFKNILSAFFPPTIHALVVSKHFALGFEKNRHVSKFTNPRFSL